MASREKRGVTRLVGSLMNPVVDAVDMNAVLEQVDLDAALQRVDLDRLLDRLDLNAILDRVDMQRLLDRVDLNAAMDRVDMNRLLDRVDIERVVARARIDQVVAGSANTVATSVLDIARRQLAGLDAITVAIARRDRHRTTTEQHSAVIGGRPAGPFTRLVAYFVDATVIAALFGLAVSLFTYLANLFLQSDFEPTRSGGAWWIVASAGFAGAYMWLMLAVAGRTFGKALLGLRVERLDGTMVGASRAFLRTVVFPFSFVLGLGFLGIVFRHDRRALHDLAAATMVVHDWGDRPAELPSAVARWLAR